MELPPQAKSGTTPGTAGNDGGISPAEQLAIALGGRTDPVIYALAKAYDWYSTNRVQMKGWERESYLAALCLGTSEQHVALLRAFTAEHIQPRMRGEIGGKDGSRSVLSGWDAETVLRALWLLYSDEGKGLIERETLELWGGWPVAEPAHFVNRLHAALDAGPDAPNAGQFRLYLSALYDAYCEDPMPVPKPDFR